MNSVAPASGALTDTTDAKSLATIDVAAALLRLVTSQNGLSTAEAQARLLRFGANMLPRPPAIPWWFALGSNFIHLFATLLWVAAVLAWMAGMPALAFAIVLVVAVNGIFSYWQQYRAERAVAALQSLLPIRAAVLRDGKETLIDATKIVVGDVLLLREGDAIPADARIVCAARFRIDASSFTGESRPVLRIAEKTETAGKSIPELHCIVLAGTHVSTGHGQAVVFATGENTQFGQLAALTHSQPNQRSPLEREVERITRTITVLALVMGVIFFVLGAGLGRLTLLEGFVFALGIIVANVPEGLLPTISLALALGVRRMAARKAIVKSLERVEALGAVTVIVTDKTGTLTKNAMTVRHIWCPGSHYALTGAGYDPHGELTPVGTSNGSLADAVATLRTAALCCDARLAKDDEQHGWQAVGDPTEAAMLVAARKCGITEDELYRSPRLAELPFDSVRKRMTTVQETSTGPLACVKGALSEVLPRCTRLIRGSSSEPLSDLSRRAIEDGGRHFGEQGLRVLAVAQRQLPAGYDYFSDGQIEQELTFLGLVAMEDPPRTEVPAAVTACKAAGIRVVMATGDDGKTAEAIGREIGLYDRGVRLITGSQLDAMTDQTLAMVLGDPDVLFARVSPIHKLRIVEAFQRRGETVAVTGDGVNDAPALKRADIGVAMGAGGTDVAREAADMILLDDNFATIIAAIEEGRGVYDNVRKFVTYIFASNVPEVVPFIAFVMFRIPLPLTVMQILAIDLGTDLLPALSLGAEQPEPDIMRRPPRRREERMLSWGTLWRAYGWLGMIEAALGLFGFFFVYWWSGWQPGETLAASGPLYVMATTMSLAAIVACQAGNVLACRSDSKSVLTLGLFSNRPLLLAMGAELAMLLGLIYFPPVARLFNLAPLQPIHWLVLATFGPLILLAEESRKLVVRLGK